MSWASHIDITIRHKIDISSINRPLFWLQILDFANISSLRTQSAFHTLKTLRQSKCERPNLEFYGYFSLEIVLYILNWKYSKLFFWLLRWRVVYVRIISREVDFVGNCIA